MHINTLLNMAAVRINMKTLFKMSTLVYVVDDRNLWFKKNRSESTDGVDICIAIQNNYMAILQSH